MRCSKSLLTGALTLLASVSFCQLTVDPSVTPTQAVEDFLLGPGVTVTNITFSGSSNQIGSFDSQNSNIPIPLGVALATGDISVAVGPNNIGSSTVGGGNFGASDADLLLANPGYTFNDAAILEFDFIPNEDVISFNFVWASEEYPEFVNSTFNDAFGFFLSGPGISGPYTDNAANIALVPGTTLPITIDNINAGDNDFGCTNCEFYNINTSNTDPNGTQMDGFTVSLEASASVQAGEVYHIKLVVADAGDTAYDSVVFLESGSFSIFSCDAGVLSFDDGSTSPLTACTTDELTFGASSNSVSNANLLYYLTDDLGIVLDSNESGDFDLNGFEAGSYFIYSLSYEGDVTIPEVGDQVDDITGDPDLGCFELSQPLEVIVEDCCSLQVECPQAEITSFNCIADIPGASSDDIVIIDACGDVSISLASSAIGLGCPGSPFEVTNTYTISDDVTTTVCEVIYAAIDDQAPEVVNPPVAEIELDCNEALPDYTPEWIDNCDDDLDLNAASSIALDGCFEVIQRSWTATDDCGNSTTVSQNITRIADTEAPIFSDYPYAITVQCDAEDIPAPTVTDECSLVEITFEDVLQSGGCYGTLVRTWIATDACGNSVSAEQIIYIDDDTAPEFINLPEEELIIGCSEDLPPAPELTAVDNCDGDLTVTFEETPLDDLSGNLCAGLTPEAFANGETCAGAIPASFVLFNFNGQEAAFFEAMNIIWSEEDDGTISIQGDVGEIGNPDGGFTLNILLENGLDWDAWSNQLFPTSYLDDCDISNGEHENWLYYLIAQGASAQGWGVYDGLELQLNHAPQNLFYGAQVGNAANGKNTNYGAAAWFTFTGTDGDEAITGSGDFFFDIACCDRSPVQRTWTAVDCLGNHTSFTQTIYFIGDVPEEGDDLSAGCEGDLNGDLAVSVDDLLILLSGFGCTGSECAGDLDNSDQTSSNDLIILLALMGMNCE